MRKRLVVAIFAVLFLTGCASANWSQSKVRGPDGSKIVPKEVSEQTTAENIIITEKDITDRNYKSLGKIKVTVNKRTALHPRPTKDAVDKKLKEEAAKIGADAVILVVYGKVKVTLVSWGSLKGEGQAIAFVD